MGNGKYSLRKALKYHAKGLDDLRCDYYLAKAHWNVRKALKLFRADSVWEKQQRVMKELGVDQKMAISLLEHHKCDVDYVIVHAKKHGTADLEIDRVDSVSTVKPSLLIDDDKGLEMTDVTYM